MNAHQISKRSRSVISCVGRQPRPTQEARSPRGFTLVELLVAIGIIVILVGILVPTVSSIRKAGQRTKSASIVSNLASAIHRYHQEFGAYPGPFSNDDIYPLNGKGPTMAENLVLSLSGGMFINSGGDPEFDPNRVGTGPRILNTSPTKANRQYPPYIEGVPLSQGRFSDDADDANDTVFPEYLDGYGDPLPILYLRAKTGARSNRPLNAQSSLDNTVCTQMTQVGQYDISQLTPYTDTNIGVGKDSSKQKKYQNSAAFPAHGLRSVQANLQYTMDQASSNYAYPYDAYALLGSPQYRSGTRFSEPRQRDGFILIAAGPDRIYGTEDDIYSFGSLE